MRGEEASAALLERVRMTGDPVAADAAQVRAGNARFTVLTARLLRMEWSSDGVFEDRGTYAFPQRRAEPPPFEVREEDGATVVDTGSLVLRHAPDGRPFHAGNLSVERAEPPAFRWVPGTVDRHNLGGARRTVDRVRGGAALDPGLVSRSGWALFDDSAGVVFAREDGWVEPRPERPDYQDWYLFGHGHDYAGAVGDYTRFGGAIPLVPRFVLGAWWSRYWPYRDAEIRSLVDDFRAHGLPLDVFVIDMDWHTTDSWTGYSWNRELFPDPRGFLAWLHDEGLHTTLNLHPALGVQAFEDAYPAFAAAMGADPAAGEAVPFRIGDRDFVRHYFELLHHPLEEEGVDFWWIDWQQGEASEVRGLDPLPWLNHLHFADMARREGVRPLIFSRWGGLGSHRYPVGFSGDSFSLWPALRFQPHYTSAGANVAYAWWSHDIGGHVGAVDPELYVRWVQFGALSPVLRLHSTNDPDYERLPVEVRRRRARRRAGRVPAALRARPLPLHRRADRLGHRRRAGPPRVLDRAGARRRLPRPRGVPLRRRDPRRAGPAPGRPGHRARDRRRLAAAGRLARAHDRRVVHGAALGPARRRARPGAAVRPARDGAAARAGRAEHGRPAGRPPHPRGLAGGRHGAAV